MRGLKNTYLHTMYVCLFRYEVDDNELDEVLIEFSEPNRAPSLTSMVCRKNVHPRVWRNNIQLVCSTNDHGIFEKSADLRVWWTSIHGKNWDRIASILWCHNVHLVWRTSIHVSKVWRISNHHYEGIKSGRQWYLLYMKWPDYCTRIIVHEKTDYCTSKCMTYLESNAIDAAKIP